MTCVRYLASVFALVPLLAGQAAAQAPCRLAAVETATVAAVLDGRTLRLSDGTEVRLIGLEDVALIGRGPAPVSAGAAAKAALAGLTLGRSIRLQSSNGFDRYRRRHALALPADPATTATIQEDLLAHGHAIVSAHVGQSGCAARFLAAERAARAVRLGLWGDPYYEIAKAGQVAALAASRGRFAIVEGKVLSVRERGTTTYVNFGRRWSSDFTVTMSKQSVRRFVAAGRPPKGFAGRRVRVRGWIDERGGPWIEATAPEQIEFADGQ